MPLRVAFIAAESEPWAKTGGLGDVVDALARALGELPSATDRQVDVFLPRYRAVPLPSGTGPGQMLRVPDPGSLDGATDVTILDVAANGYRLRLVDAPEAFDRDGFYGPPGGGDFADNAHRFGLLCRAALEVLRLEADRPVDVIHLHDWHSCPAALYRERPFGDDPVLKRAAIVLTLHNLAYHGWTPAEDLRQLGFAPGDGIVRRGADGLDPSVWNPATDTDLAATYGPEDLSGKAACRADLLTRLGFDPVDDAPVLGMIGRLDPQKGFDLLADAAPRLLAAGARLAVQGSGDPKIAADLRSLAAERPDRVALIERFDRAMARRIYAGADFFLMPSRFEPCGTGQMISLRYATPPIVRRTGGLADSVIDELTNPGKGTGFAFDAATPRALAKACEAAIAMRAAGGAPWNALVARGMAVDFDWARGSAPKYLALYERALSIRLPHPA